MKRAQKPLSSGARATLALLRERGPMSVQQLCQELNRRFGAVTNYLGELKRRGLARPSDRKTIGELGWQVICYEATVGGGIHVTPTDVSDAVRRAHLLGPEASRGDVAGLFGLAQRLLSEADLDARRLSEVLELVWRAGAQTAQDSTEPWDRDSPS